MIPKVALNGSSLLWIHVTSCIANVSKPTIVIKCDPYNPNPSGYNNGQCTKSQLQRKFLHYKANKFPTKM